MPTMPTLDPKVVLGLPREALPRHIAVIMDGNGRWAQQRNLPRIEGHRHAAAAVRETVERCAQLGIGYLTLYSFSLENWKRPRLEVEGLMALYAEYLASERQTIMDNDIRVRHVGRREGLPENVLRELDTTERLSRDNQGLTLCLALNYGSRTEIVDAVRLLAERVARGELRPEEIEEVTITGALYTAGIPDPDLVVRTASEMRISNFLLWQISYAELYVMPVLWPDFREEHLYEAIRNYAGRERRYGAVSKPLADSQLNDPGD
ncbi:MAG: isoprenyl transferase [Phycisphaerae bacterium]|nr:isoprenyl transferase [Phycisphaerae bacterium]